MMLKRLVPMALAASLTLAAPAQAASLPILTGGATDVLLPGLNITANAVLDEESSHLKGKIFYDFEPLGIQVNAPVECALAVGNQAVAAGPDRQNPTQWWAIRVQDNGTSADLVSALGPMSQSQAMTQCLTVGGAAVPVLDGNFTVRAPA
jgi:hypothetical protein